MLGKNIGVDLGTASVIIYAEGRGIVLTEPSVVAYNTKTGRMCAVGRKAYEMLGRNPDSIRVVRPMKDGVVSDFTATRQMLSRYLARVCGNAIFKPNIIVCTPSSVTNLERRTILDMITAAGAGKACLMEEPLAAAIGAGSDITHATGTMVVDIGGGTTDIAVITLGSIAISKSVKVAGNLFDESIARLIRREKDVVIGTRTAEEIKKQIGCAVLRDEEVAMTIKGKRYTNGLPATVEVTSTDCYLAMREHIEAIGEAVRSVLELTPPELVGDIGTSGILLTGGGAMLKEMSEAITLKTGIKTRLATDPQNCVAKGIGLALGDLDMLSEHGYIFKTREEITGYVDTN